MVAMQTVANGLRPQGLRPFLFESPTLDPLCDDAWHATLSSPADDAPDIYESAELNEGSQQASHMRMNILSTFYSYAQDDLNASQSSSDAEDQADPSRPGISRRRLQIDHARDKFDASRVDASKADFSDSLEAQKQSYIVHNRRQKAGRRPSQEPDSDEDDTSEGIARRIARLNREIEEVRSALQQRELGPSGGDSDEPKTRPLDTIGDDVEFSHGEADIAALVRALESVQTSQRHALSAHARLAAQLAQPSRPKTLTESSSPANAVSAPEPIDSTTLSKLVSFDTRLASLESALGLDAADQSTAAVPVLPTLTLLDKQIALLTSPDAVPDLEAKLTAMRALSVATAGAKDHPDSEATSDQISSQDLLQLRNLYSLLPTLTTLSPTVGPLLDRLRVLRHLHTDAAGAKENLDKLEQQQAEMDQEIRAWKDGLAAVEAAVAKAEEGFKTNVGAVEKWVAQLEQNVRSSEQ
ncbi:hypothetical protein ANO11243_065310 [Dothideomycetidae sp. 11243]|nr:hypothetical protein ANO11243_065310 [fungal sp. No.11243]